MMQNVVVWLVVALAAWYVGRRLFAMLRGLVTAKADCATGCGTCSFSPNEGQASTVIPISSITISPH